MPAPADIGLLGFFLTHFSDLRVAWNRGKKFVEHDIAKAPGEGQVILGAQRLVAKKQQAILRKGSAQLPQLCVAEGGQLEIVDHGPAARRKRCYFHNAYYTSWPQMIPVTRVTPLSPFLHTLAPKTVCLRGAGITIFGPF